MRKPHQPQIEYTVVWHGAIWRDDFHPVPAPDLRVGGRPVGGEYVSDKNATRSGHFRKDDER